jgi:hypothetical protein
MSNDIPRDDEESLHDDAVTPEEAGRGDGEIGGREETETPENRDATAGGDQGAETRERGEVEETEEEAFLVSEEGLAGSAEASALVAGKPQAAPAVEQAAVEESSVNEPPPPAVDRRKAPRGPRPSLEEEREPVFHDEGGYRMRMEPAALAKLRELPGAKGKTDRELGEEFFKGQSARLVASMAGDVETPAEVRVVVDPYSRQAFLAVGRTIRGIVSF